MRSHIASKGHRMAVQAIPQSGWRRAVRKNMAKMSIAFRTADLRANHPMGAILDLGYGGWIYGFEKAWPSASGVEFGIGLKQCLAAAHTIIAASLKAVPKGAGESAFRSALAGDMKLFGRQLFTPLGLALMHLRFVRAHNVPRFNVLQEIGWADRFGKPGLPALSEGLVYIWLYRYWKFSF